MKEKYAKLWHKALLYGVDALTVTIAALCAYLCTMVSEVRIGWPLVIWWLINVAVTVLVFYLFDLYNLVMSSIGIPEICKGFVACLVLAVGNVLFAVLTDSAYVKPSTTVVYSLLLFFFVVAIRISKRLLLHIELSILRKKKNHIRVMIVGGGAAGLMVIKEMQDSQKSIYTPVCIVDDDKEKHGKLVHGVRICGTTADVKQLAEQYAVQEIFITIPTVDKRREKEIIKLCQECNCPIKILPGIYQMATGEVTIEQFRKVDVQDLLGREQTRVNLDEIMGYIENKVVLVTGGGGSIGSELCRQIAAKNPHTLIILDIYENSVYDVEQELKRVHPELNILTLIASIRDRNKIHTIFERYRPQIVFHAAAHKHVPLMETSPEEAVKNNVFGTLNVAQCADEFAVETFVQISTDKAVNPTNIMGATKRICEMIIQTIGRHSERTKFVAVRFGNVLGSNGSVIPLFKKQLAEGGPLTVTHKDIIRYFMTIPEAVSLVLQAGAYAKGGQIFVLDMGEPVRIYDLAYNLIKLSGYEPNVDIDIVCTGLRPGEKLYEERLMEEEGLQKTENGMINIAKPIEIDEANFWGRLERLREEAQGATCDLKQAVRELVPTYTIDKRDSIAEALHLANAKTDEKVG